RPYSYGLMEGVMHSGVFMAQMATGNIAIGGAKTAGMSVARKILQGSAETLGKASLMPGTYRQMGENYTGMVEYDDETGKIHLRQDLYERAMAERISMKETAVTELSNLSGGGNYNDPERTKKIEELKALIEK